MLTATFSPNSRDNVGCNQPNIMGVIAPSQLNFVKKVSLEKMRLIYILVYYHQYRSDQLWLQSTN